ncbi:amidoligase family protein [Hungatella effluvii]|uniref:amidoligase family protein n=1 Tax=Hungatella effluvii TaxID=1096246 RepID=UPI0022E1499B|nr:amidoligase family protein [Hungatella effluvii]
MDMIEQRFGIEIEMTGVSREQAAQVAAHFFGTTARYVGTYYDVYAATDSLRREWKFMSDSSITPQRMVQGEIIGASNSYKTEMVSPICRYEDIVLIQELVRNLRKAGALTNGSCGIHVHIDASPFDARTLRNITNIMASKEDLIYKALQVSVDRKNRFCQPVEERFLRELNRKKPKSLSEVSRIWYNGSSRQSNHYDDSRYRCLNLHSVFQKGTVEFRLFNGTMHAGKIKAYIQLCLAIGAQALNQSCASRRKTQTTNEKYTFRTWLLRLGLNGPEFKTARQHLLENLDGCIAWKDPAQAEEQKERMRIKREREQEKRQASETQGGAEPGIGQQERVEDVEVEAQTSAFSVLSSM